jgi:hexulose-6-phosphate isomerase
LLSLAAEIVRRAHNLIFARSAATIEYPSALNPAFRHMGQSMVDSPLDFNRRAFLRTSAAAAASTAFLSTASLGLAAPKSEKKKQNAADTAGKGRIYKAVKWDMIAGGGSVLEKFQLQKELGYDGMELISPWHGNIAEVRAASEKTGMPVHAVVDMKHWEIRLSSPDSKVRAKGLAFLEQSLRDAHAFGGSAVLLVPGKVTGKDETHDDVWKRSIAEIRKALPLASKVGVRICIENVWNGFCETPEQARDYVDAIDSCWVGAWFDIGNCRKFGRSEDWVRTLGSRIVKLDCKDWSKQNGFKSKIGDGDVDWPAVRQALADIGYTGWCTAEVDGGNRDVLADIAQRMNRVLLL